MADADCESNQQQQLLLESDDGNQSGYETFAYSQHPPSKFNNWINNRKRCSQTTSSSVMLEIGRVSLSWHEVSAYVNDNNNSSFSCCSSQKQQQILHNVTGCVKPGQLLAIIGGSGAGKSTLLNFLTCRNDHSVMTEGAVKVNGIHMNDGIESISAYVQQQDLFVEQLTVREHLWFQALLRMQKGLSLKNRRIRVHEVMQQMGLDKCSNTAISCLSGGQRKRLSFGSELLTDPPLLFCDEPTSGLDSFMAETVVRTLCDLASAGRTILCTIHQPSSETFALFDQLLVLVEGRVAYHGAAAEAGNFFNDCGLKCPENYNPADHMIHSLAVRAGDECASRKRILEVADAFSCSRWRRQLNAEVETLNEKSDSSQHVAAVARRLHLQMSHTKASCIRQMRALLWRCAIAQIRNPNVCAIRIGQILILALIISAVYFNQHHNQFGIMNINGALFIFTCCMTFSNFYTVLNSFPNDLPLFFRENRNGMYSTAAYFVAKNLAEIPLFAIIPLLFLTCSYWLIGLIPHLLQFVIACAALILVSAVSVSLAYLISTACTSIDIALAVSGPVLLPMQMFGGFFLNQGSMPIFLYWLRYLSWFGYAFEILVVNQWSNIQSISCSDSNQSHCLRSGAEVISSFSFSQNSLSFNFAMLCCLTFAFRFAAFICLWLRVIWNKRR